MSNDDDATLAGYLRVHDRPPAFEGSDGHPYTVSIECEKTADLRTPWVGFLVFPRWAQNGVGIVGHAESGDLVRGSSRDQITQQLGALTLPEVQAVLEAVIDAQSR